MAYVSAFRIFANLYLNTVGFAYIGKDFMVCLPIDKRDGIPLETTTPPASSLTRKLSIIKTQKTLVLGSSADVDDFASSEENSDQLVAANIGGLEKLVVMNEIKDSCSPRLSKRFSNSINPSPPSVLPPSARSSPTLSATALNIPNNSTPSRFAQIKNTMIPNWLLNPGPNTKMWINAFKNPSFFAVILGLIIATSASLKHLFVSLNAVPGQPLPIGSEPVLQVLTEFFTFLGQFAVPIGLLNLGAALGRLSVKTFFSWKVILSIAFSRLVLLPVIGITLVQVLTYHASLIDPNDKMLRFVLMLQGNSNMYKDGETRAA